MTLRWLGKLLGKKLGLLHADQGKFLTEEKLWQLLSLVDADSRPNLNALRQVANTIDPVSLNIKQLGYSLARQIGAALPPSENTHASIANLRSSLSTQSAIESEWVAHWCSQLKIPVVFHRKVWELCFVLQALYEAGLLTPGARGVGFGCGMEPLPSYLAASGVGVLATDLEPERAGAWVDSSQNMGALDNAFMDHLVSRAAFDEQVDFRYVDMNAIPDEITGYDFCWSICALEHLGSIAQGLDFIENALSTLRPGGTAVHTTEFNIQATGPTIDNWPSIAFQRRHMEDLARRLQAQGHEVVPFDFSPGDKPLDRFVDLPPWHHDLPDDTRAWLGDPLHLKVSYEGVVLTCIGIIIRKAA